MAAAALTLQWDGVRRDLSSQAFFPCIHVCMSHPSVGVRYAACQCARVLCRSVSVLRTSVVDSGMGKVLFELVKNPDEDLRVKVAAMAGICNLLNDFSPMRTVRILTI
jgi:armadillo repeat-containing protein 8